MYLIKLGYGRVGRWWGFESIGVDKKSFELLSTLSEEWNDDDLYEKDDPACLLAALCIKSGWDQLDLSELKDHPQVLAYAEELEILPAQAPYDDVHVIVIFNNYT